MNLHGFKDASDPPQNRRTRMLKNYRDLKVWQTPYRLCFNLYRETTKPLKEESYGLTSKGS